MTPKMKFALIVTMLATLPACATQRPGLQPAASVSAAQTSWCQGDTVLPVRAAPAAEFNDVGNRFDADDTTNEKLAHNGRYHAACPDEN